VVNQQFAFAVHILAMLAYSGTTLDSRTIAASVNTNPVVVRRLLLALRKAGLISTVTGKNGGALLAKPAKQVSLLDIFEAVQPRCFIAPNRRHTFKKCPVSCSMKGIMTEVSQGTDRVIRKHLGSVTLDQVVRKIR
jgi:Rrf2 family protein